MASPSTYQARNGCSLETRTRAQDMDEDTDTLSDRNFNHSPYMDQGPDDSTHPDRCVNESPQTDHDDMEDQSESENGDIKHYKENSYWETEYAGHLWDGDYGWRVLKPGCPPEPWWIEDPPIRSPSDPDYLCDACRHINFCWLFENNMPKARRFGERNISTGTFGRVLKQTNCSFCVFLASSFRRISSEDRPLTHSKVYIGSRYFSQSSNLDYNHPITEVRYLNIISSKAKMDIQVLDNSLTMRGRQISPYIKQQQINVARQWLETCEHEHCNGKDAAVVPNLALIDLNERCIVRPHGPVRYAALSYVWGKSPQRMYTKNTREEFETKGALHSKQGFLPQTITDAMDLAAHIRLDYLWVDSLCIIQDDEADKIYFISRMGSIYGASAITIVDANGDHAGSGLVGMSSPRENVQIIATVQGMQLCTTASNFMEPWETYHTCAWFQRGWTYQEMLLSKRLLFVTHAQLQFVCNHTVYLEETHPHSPRTSDWTMPTLGDVPIRRSLAAELPIWYLYCTAVQLFTRRVLSYDMDVIPAFDAIFKSLYKDTDVKSLFNLPDVEIEEALLWKSYYPSDLLPSLLSRKERRRHPDQLPTWSWAGWRGEKEYDPMFDTPPISAVLWRCSSTSTVDKRSEFTLQDYRCADWREKGWEYKTLTHWTFRAYTHNSRPNVFFRNPIALEPNSGLRKPSFLDDSNVLHFSAFIVHISASGIRPGLRFDDQVKLYPSKTRQIFDSSHYFAGRIWLDCLPANEVGLRLVALARCPEELEIYESDQQLRNNLRKVAPLDWDPKYFKNISQPNNVGKNNVGDRLGDDWDMSEHCDPKRFQDKFYPLYSVLLVEMREGIAYRIGVGKVHIDAFHAGNPIWEDVRLG